MLHDALGLILVMYNVPSLPTLPPSSRVLRALWPRLRAYVFLNASDPLYAMCAAGAGGDEAAAGGCMAGWVNERAPALQAQLAVGKAALWASFPNLDGDGVPLSGSYWNEADVDDPEWARSHWGDAVYARLRDVKRELDPTGLFVCHHCVGSEDWSPDGNCRVAT